LQYKQGRCGCDGEIGGDYAGIAALLKFSVYSMLDCIQHLSQHITTCTTRSLGGTHVVDKPAALSPTWLHVNKLTNLLSLLSVQQERL